MRQLIDSVTCLAIAVMLFRAFGLEGYIISTGSMAPGLLGYHKQLVCPDCRFEFAYGVAFDSQSTESPRLARCPNCGQDAIDTKPVPRNEGDQLLVFKTAYSVRDPRRWEPVVFLNPNDPTQAYVKRAAGLPGESIQIRHGDLYINDQLQRKPLAQQRAVRIPVFDHDHAPNRDDWRPRWRPDDSWKRIGRSFVLDHSVDEIEANWSIVRYVHNAWPLSAQRKTTFPRSRDIRGTMITDRYGYNRASLINNEIEVSDLMLATKVLIPDSGPELLVVLQHRDRKAVCRINSRHRRLDAWVLDHDRNTALPNAEELDAPHDSRTLNPEWLGHEVELEVSTFDQRLTVAIEGETLIRYDFLASVDGDTPRRNDGVSNDRSLAGRRPTVTGLAAGEFSSGFNRPRTSVAGRRGRDESNDARPTQERRTRRNRAGQTPTIQFAARGGPVRISSLRLYRDVHYTSSPHQHAVARPLTLGPDQFFFLGDNSPVSLDSRSWSEPVVSRRLFIGKPIVVHLPSKPGRLRIGNRETHVRVPDLSRVRVIR